MSKKSKDAPPPPHGGSRRVTWHLLSAETTTTPTTEAAATPVPAPAAASSASSQGRGIRRVTWHLPSVETKTKEAAAAPAPAHDPAAATASSSLEWHLVLIAFTVTFAISLGVYLRTVAPSIAGGDAGELVAEGCTLGTSHPPGYPLYTVLVFIVTSLGKRFGDPSRSPAYFVNVMSCVFGALTSGLISASVLHLSSDDLMGKQTKDWPRKQSSESKLKTDPAHILIRAGAAVTAGLLHTFSPLAWQYSTTAEVFALHNLFICLLVYVSIQFALQKTQRLVLVGSFLCGLSLTNQHTSVLLELPLILWVVGVTRMYKDWRLLVKSAGCFLVGLSVYAALPYLALTRPHAGSWGDVTTLSGFINHLRRKDYGTLRLYSGDDTQTEGLFERILMWLRDFSLVQAGNPAVLFKSCYGSIMLWTQQDNEGSTHRCRPRRPVKQKQPKMDATATTWKTSGIGRMLVTSFLFYMFAFHSLANLPLWNRLLFGIHQRFWMHPNILAFLFAGVGMGKVCCHLTKYNRPASIWISAGLMLASASHSYHKNFRISDQSSNMYFNNYARGILDPLPENSLLLINYDQQWTSIRYVQECEGIRNDVTSINLSMMSYPWWKSKQELYPNVLFPGTHYTKENTVQWHEGGFTFTELLVANYHSFPGGIFVGGHLNYPDTRYLNNFTEIPYGMSRRFVKKAECDASDVEKFRRDSLDVWKVLSKHHINDLPGEGKYPEETWEWTIKREFFTHLVSRATHLLDVSVSVEGTGVPVLRSLVDAASWLEAASLNDGLSVNPALKKNLGLAYMHIVRNKESYPFLPDVEDIFADSGNSEFMQGVRDIWWSEGLQEGRSEWKTWASTRWSDTWGEFLNMTGAEEDPSFDQVKSIYDMVMGTAQRKRNDG